MFLPYVSVESKSDVVFYKVVYVSWGNLCGKRPIVIEFKLVEKSDENAHESVLADALKQIRDRGYAEELSSAGIQDILEIAVAFRGKELWIRQGPEKIRRPCRID